jgi:hypothetical protein
VTPATADSASPALVPVRQSGETGGFPDKAIKPASPGIAPGGAGFLTDATLNGTALPDQKWEGWLPQLQGLLFAPYTSSRPLVLVASEGSIVAINTLPFATVGTANFVAFPGTSRAGH